MVFSTCTFNPIENEAVVATLVEIFRDSISVVREESQATSIGSSDIGLDANCSGHYVLISPPFSSLTFLWGGVRWTYPANW